MYEIDVDNFKYDEYQNLKLYFIDDDFNELNCKKESVACYNLFKWYLGRLFYKVFFYFIIF